MHCRTDTQSLRLWVWEVRKDWSRVSKSFCSEISSPKTNPARCCFWTHSRETKSSKLHGFDCSQKHAYRALGRQQSDIWGQNVTLVMSPDRAASSCCFDSIDYGPSGTRRQSWASFWGRVSLTVTWRYADRGRLLNALRHERQFD